MGKLLELALYNPARLSDEDFLAGFVARRSTAELIASRLRQIKPRGLAQHRLIVGQRGMGKTSLLRWIALALRRDSQLATALIPLSFREEQYNVHSLHKLWCNCLDALGDYFEDSGDSGKAEDLDADIAKLDRTQDKDGNQALSLFRAWTRKEGRRPLLLIDNIDIVLGGLSKDGWNLRRVLQEAGGIVVIGGSTSALEAAVDPQAPFYDFFQVDLLEPLDLDEVKACLRRLASLRGDSGRVVEQMLATDPARIQVLHDLTGGNPRTLAMLYLVLEGSENEDVMADLDRLLDQATPLYKARIEELAPQTRVVFDAVALRWDPVVAANIASDTTLAVASVSTQLDRLVQDGVVRKTSLSTTRRIGYQISERFFNIWYLMRHGPRRQRQRLKWLTEALRRIYTPSELENRAKTILQHALTAESQTQASLCLAVGDALGEGLLRTSLLERAFRFDPRLRVEVAAGTPNIAADTTELESTRYRKAVEQNPTDGTSWELLGHSFLPEQLEEAEAAFRKATEVDPTLATAWHNLANLLTIFKRLDEAELAYRRALDASPNSAPSWTGLGSLFVLTDRLQEAEAAFLRAVDVDPTFATGWLGRGQVLHLLDRYEEAESAFKRAIYSDPERAAAWYGLSLTLKQLDRLDEAEAGLRRAVELDPKDADTWVTLGGVLQMLQRLEQAEVAYQQAIELDPELGYAWYRLGGVLYLLKSFDKARDAFWRAIELDSHLWRAWLGMGGSLHRLQRFEEAEAAIRRATEIDSSREYGWLALGGSLYQLERFDEAECAFRRATETDPNLAPAWSGLGDVLQQLNRLEEAEASYGRANELDPRFVPAWNGLTHLFARLERLDEAVIAIQNSLELEPSAGSSWANLGFLLLQKGQSAEAEAAVRKGVTLDNWPAVEIVSAWDLLGNILADHLDRPREAEEAYLQALSIDPLAFSPRSNLCYLLIRQSRFSEMEEHYRHVIENVPTPGAKLLQAFRYLAESNLESALANLGPVMQENHPALLTIFRDDLLRFLRLAASKGWGSCLLEWFDRSGLIERFRPIWVAYDAYLHGEDRLRDVNPEVRGGARKLLTELGPSPESPTLTSRPENTGKKKKRQSRAGAS